MSQGVDLPLFSDAGRGGNVARQTKPSVLVGLNDSYRAAPTHTCAAAFRQISAATVLAMRMADYPRPILAFIAKQG